MPAESSAGDKNKQDVSIQLMNDKRAKSRVPLGLTVSLSYLIDFGI